ncbi:zinc ribbon-containing protein [Biformimicrobium ophioploci]|uniref:Uncharacterized protein n=1 Tax=Biformimicrobium ophioploci TaxID=3036711 RepID=A0ABQ6LWM7_9GAMM|nr:hypothetical protein [Microbulbifer sp. NKW57]GMG86492.1 hypothetical protein MNKW57_08130 [Microbulbifer sp. NKW57]
MSKKRPEQGDEGLADEVQRDLEKLVKEELGVENLTANKLAFLKAWLKDDAHRAGTYMRELAGELLTLEERTGDWLQGAADPTESAWPSLMYCIKNGLPWALAGEKVGVGEELECMGCGYRATPPVGEPITPCHRCGYGCFRQITGGLTE